MRTRTGDLAEAMPRIRKEIAQAENVIIESNSILRFLRPTCTSAFSTLTQPTSKNQQSISSTAPTPFSSPKAI